MKKRNRSPGAPRCAAHGGLARKCEQCHLEDNLAHVEAFYKELVALIIHGDFKADVDLSPGSGVGTQAMDAVQQLRHLHFVVRVWFGAPKGSTTRATALGGLEQALRDMEKGVTPEPHVNGVARRLYDQFRANGQMGPR